MTQKFDPLWVAYTELTAPMCDGAFISSPEARASARAVLENYLKDHPEVSEDQLWSDLREREHLLESRIPIPDIVMEDGLVLPGTVTKARTEKKQPGIFDAFERRRP